FLETAKKLKMVTDRNIRFIWIGNGEDKQPLEESLTIEEQEYIHFIGHQDDVAKLLAASDVFFLSSREDPFPLVVLLAAQHHVPAICFEKATGITEFVQNDAGICLPEISSESASQALKKLIDNDLLLKEMGIKAHQRFFSSYTTEKKMIEVFSTIKRYTHYKPSVSVIVPFYNHESFIEERLDSILTQDIKDIEIIALDDCSSDASVARVQNYLTDSRIQLYLNKHNSGSPFKQWKKGIDIAKSDIVWIAEGDDSCSENFLSKLLPYFDDSLINIVSAKTEMINENGDIQLDAFKPYFDKAYPKKFDSSYIKTGIKEVNEQLGAMCTLVNASGLLIRRSSFGETLNEAQNFKMCGDWLIYLECLKNGKIAYDIDATNYFRRHSASQVKKVEGTDVYFNERRLITEYVFSNFTTTKQLRMKAFDEVDSEWERFKYKNPDNELSDYYDKKRLWQAALEIQANRLPSIAVVASDFSPGGGQLFSIRVANAWKKIGGNVILLNVGHFPEHSEVVKKIDVTIPVFDVNKIGIADLLEAYDIDVIHSSIWWSDKYVHEIFQKLPQKVKWIVSMHGCYETLLEHIDAEPDFKRYFENMLFEVDGWVYTAEKNKKVFEAFYMPDRVKKIINGYEPEMPKISSREAFGIREDSFVFCLASRAMATKGWYLAVDAVDKLNNIGYKVDLLLIGEGEAKTELEKIANHEYIHFIGQVSNLQDYIAVSDAGLLPSFFLGESMPLVLIEFMAQGKPMISTNVGEIVDMTSDKEGSAALILELHQNKINLEELVDAVRRVCTDSKHIEKLRVNSKRMFQRFEMSKTMEEYAKVYS
ncbi:MAG: glycosyltransferase, partial [Sulfurimonas sp.]|nr:glycosyltransferase [Sulfurimonas sp.]